MFIFIINRAIEVFLDHVVCLVWKDFPEKKETKDIQERKEKLVQRLLVKRDYQDCQVGILTLIHSS